MLNRCTTAPRIKVSDIIYRQYINILTAAVTFFNTCQENCSVIDLAMEKFYSQFLDALVEWIKIGGDLNGIGRQNHC